MEATPPPAAPTPVASVPRGPKAYRRQVRQRGPLAGLLPPALIGLLGLLMLRNNTATWRGIGGFLLSIVAAPVLLVTGVPLTTGHSYNLALLGSAALWVLLGTIAARMATRTPVATWRDYWREYLWLAGGVWIGIVVALIAANLILGGAFL
ncbi:MAG: hypothetical protein K8R99_00250 [Actinomycetia bacterium]|nr:hypothetical protein [Actinomycetes bacterium]